VKGEIGASIGEVGAGFMRVAWRALVVVLAIGLVAEVVLRAKGLQPQNLYRVGFSATVIDRWTEWAMRPNVRLNEYAVTNAYGLHEDREINLQKTPGVPRVAVIGSSVTWGLGEALENTIPRSAQRALEKSGCPAEVLNFGNQGFNILNASAFLQAKMHQFNPDAVVVMMDLQMGFPRFPLPNPITDEQAVVRRLGFWEATFKRATEYSVVLTALDNVNISRAVIAPWVPFPVEPKKVEVNAKGAAPPPADAGLKAFGDAWKWIGDRVAGVFEPLKEKDPGGAAVVAAAKPVPPAPKARTPEEYERRRERELGSVVSAMAAFARSMGFRLYFTTPYGPYFHASDAQLAKFSLNMIAEATPIYGSLAAATRREAEIQSRVIASAAPSEGAAVIDMSAASRDATMADGDFSTDGIHLSAKGYRHMGDVIAARLMRDGLCAAAAKAR
jgi:lysophospholipase L1-like esterase